MDIVTQLHTTSPLVEGQTYASGEYRINKMIYDCRATIPAQMRFA